MKIAFYASIHKDREDEVSSAFASGAKALGVPCDVIPKERGIQAGYDLSVMIGVKSIDLMRDSIAKKTNVCFLDKGYMKSSNKWRFSVNSHQPTEYIHKLNSPGDRRDAMDWDEFAAWVDRPDGYIVMAMSSQKYHEIAGLGDANAYAEQCIREIQKYSRRRIIYRPKPSWKDARPIDGAKFSRERPIAESLTSAAVCVTYGSGACVDAIRLGVPVIVLGDACARSICSNSLAEVENPRRASDAERLQFLADLAYCQWHTNELRDGSAVRYILRTVAEYGL